MVYIGDMKIQDVMDFPQVNSAAQLAGVLRRHLQVSSRSPSLNSVDYNRKHECFCVNGVWRPGIHAGFGFLSSPHSPTTGSLTEPGAHRLAEHPASGTHQSLPSQSWARRLALPLSL